MSAVPFASPIATSNARGRFRLLKRQGACNAPLHVRNDLAGTISGTNAYPFGRGWCQAHYSEPMSGTLVGAGVSRIRRSWCIELPPGLRMFLLFPIWDLPAQPAVPE